MTIHLKLEHLDLLCILDGLASQAYAWEATEHYLMTGNVTEDTVLEECSDVEQASRAATRCRLLIANIRKQI